MSLLCHLKDNMLSHLTGNVTIISEQLLVLDMGSLGVSIQVPNTINFHKGEKVTLHTYLHWNQEQGPSLFGFSSPAERTIFSLIIECSGIGPKIGLAVLAKLGIDQCIWAIKNEDVKLFSTVPGIGTKKAEQMLVFLKHKTTKLDDLNHLSISSITPYLADLTQALQALHYSKLEINQAINLLKTTADETTIVSFSDALKKTLSYLTK